MKTHELSPQSYLFSSLRLLAAGFGLGALIFSAAAETLSDNFDTTHDYSGGDVSGTIWSGLLNSNNATTADANATNAGVFTLASTANNTGFDAGHNNAPFLYLDVSGDFDARVEVTSASSGQFSVASLMARGTPTTTGGSNNGENFVSLDYRNFAPQSDSGRNLVAGSETDNVGFPQDPYLELTRTGDTFNLLTSPDGITYTLQTSYSRPDLADQSVQVGLDYATYNNVSGVATFDNFSISGTNVPEPSTWAAIGAGAVLLLSLRRRAIRIE